MLITGEQPGHARHGATPAGSVADGARAPSRLANALLWAVQVPVALVLLLAGGAKLLTPLAVLAQQTPVPGLLLRGVGILEVLGAIGLLLPGILRLRASLTPLAAAGLLIVMAGATGATLALGDPDAVVAPAVLGMLLLVVLVGRWRVAPHPDPRTRREPAHG